MLRILKYFLSFVLCGIFVSCGGHSLEKEVEEFMKMKIRIPEQMLKIEGGVSSVSSFEQTSPLLVFFYGKGECSECSMNKIEEYLDGFNKINKT